MAFVMPDNAPGWFKAGFQWLVLGVILSIGYLDLRSVAMQALETGKANNAELREIGLTIDHLDVDRAELMRLRKDLDDFKSEYRQWRDVINRERTTRPQ